MHIYPSGRGGGADHGSGAQAGFNKEYSVPGSSLRKPRWDMNSLPRFEKNFYREHPAVQSRSLVSFFKFSIILLYICYYLLMF